MICLILLASICIYCCFNLSKMQSWENFYDVFYTMGGIITGVSTFVILIAAFTGGISSSAEFEGAKEIRKNLEYQIARPVARDDNFFEQLSEYNATIIENQTYNKDWFLNGICVSNKWDTIEPLTFSEAN